MAGVSALGLLAASAAAAAPSHVAARTASATSSSSISVGTPAGVAAGDVLVATVTARLAASASIGAPAGWTLVRRDSCSGPGGTLLTQALYVHAASVGEPVSRQWTLGSSTSVSAGIVAYRGVSSTSPVVASSGGFNRNSRYVRAPS